MLIRLLFCSSSSWFVDWKKCLFMIFIVGCLWKKDEWFLSCGCFCQQKKYMLNYSFSESSDEMEDRLDKPILGGPLTIDVVLYNLYQPITISDKFKLSNMIWATPMNTFLPSIRP